MFEKQIIHPFYCKNGVEFAVTAGVTLLIKELLAGYLNDGFASKGFCKMKYCSCMHCSFIGPGERGGSKAVGGDIKLLKTCWKIAENKVGTKSGMAGT